MLQAVRSLLLQVHRELILLLILLPQVVVARCDCNNIGNDQSYYYSTFDPVAAICSGTTLIPLPTTSLNNITGIWSPALNNTTPLLIHLLQLQDSVLLQLL
jgi:hypothetical protein